MDQIGLGIDFGTTTTSVSLRYGISKPIALAIGEDGVTPYIPSVVYFQPSASSGLAGGVIGEEAERSRGKGFVIHSIKRCLGCDGKRCASNRTARYYWCNGDGKIQIPNIGVFKPQDIAFIIVREAFDRALRVMREQYNIVIDEALGSFPLNLGCPAAFGFKERNVLAQIAHEYGFTDVTIENVVEEPILAGLAFSRYQDQLEGRVLVYDFGGGSFDTAVLDVDRVNGVQRITILSTAGHAWLGGDDIDTLIHEHFIYQIAQSVGATTEQVTKQLEPIDIWRLRSFSKRAKELLSDTDQFSDSLASDFFGPIPLDLSRSEMEGLIWTTKSHGENMIERSFDAVLSACNLANAFNIAAQSDLMDLSAFDNSLEEAALRIDRVLLVGGVSKIPLVRSAVTQIFGLSKIVSESIINPIVAVAEGAAYPREKQHYSLANPPFEMVLDLFESQSRQVKTERVFSPYDHFGFDMRWVGVNTLPIHRRELIEIPQDYQEGILRFRRVGDPNWTEYSLGRIRAGNNWFEVKLDGTLVHHYGAEQYHDLFKHSLTHPIQEKIDAARRERQASREQDEISRSRDRDKTIMTEN